MTFFHMALKGVIAWVVIKLGRLPVPTVSWRDFWLQYSLLAAATAVGAIVGMVLAAAKIGETLL